MRTASWVSVAALLGLSVGSSSALADTAKFSESVSLDDIAKGGHNKLELGLGLGLFIPNDEHELYDPAVGPQQRLVDISPDVMARLGFFPVAFAGIEGEAGTAFSETEAGGSTPILSLRASLVLQFPAKVTPFVFGGIGNMWLRSSDDILGDDRDRVFHGGVGAKLHLTDRAHLRLDGRLYRTNRLRSADGDDNGMTNHFGVTLGAGFALGGEKSKPPVEDPDPDGDGIEGAADACPDEAGLPPDGCPAKDTDGDSIMDADDTCPKEPETRNGHEDTDGCPDQVPDADGDGITGDADKCPDQPEDVDGFEDGDGCPESDNDEDGVTDASDKCPTDAGPVENRGCPDTDRDGDTVVDRLDNCPDEAGTPENQGCKKKQLVVITNKQLKILDKVFFANNRATIQRRSRRLLDNVAEVIKAHPEIEKIRVEGHTDDRGPDDKNKELSQRRADAVKAYLVEKGVAAERLEAVGFGEERAIADNKTAKGRAENRRVEFNIPDQTETDTVDPDEAGEGEAGESEAGEGEAGEGAKKEDSTLKPE